MAVHSRDEPIDGRSVCGGYYCDLCGLMFRAHFNLIRVMEYFERIVLLILSMTVYLLEEHYPGNMSNPRGLTKIRAGVGFYMRSQIGFSAKSLRV